MTNVPKDYRYTHDHEWLSAAGTNWKMGITQFAANQLGDVVLVELAKVGDLVTKGQELGTVESVKAVSELFAPVSGKIIEVNSKLDGDPELVNTDPHGEGWMVVIEATDKTEVDELMTADAYEKFIAEENH